MKGKKSMGRFRSSWIPQEAMEVIADVLIASLSQPGDCRAYSEDQLRRKQQRTALAELRSGIASAQRIADVPSNNVPDCPKVTEQELAAWKKYLEGYSAPEIAGFLGVTRPTAVRLIRNAAKRLSSDRSAFCGVNEVYRRDIHRTIYRKPTHCGEQPCRRLGYCKYALISE